LFAGDVYTLLVATTAVRGQEHLILEVRDFPIVLDLNADAVSAEVHAVYQMSYMVLAVLVITIDGGSRHPGPTVEDLDLRVLAEHEFSFFELKFWIH
jgi:hypothetical protein